jgi:hypothetical protein
LTVIFFKELFKTADLSLISCYKMTLIENFFTKMKYPRCAMITRLSFETAFDYKLLISDQKIEEFPCLVHKLSSTLNNRSTI